MTHIYIENLKNPLFERNLIGHIHSEFSQKIIQRKKVNLYLGYFPVRCN